MMLSEDKDLLDDMLMANNTILINNSHLVLFNLKKKATSKQNEVSFREPWLCLMRNGK